MRVVRSDSATDHTSGIHVTKRDGSHEPYDVRKIREVILWATAGIKVSPIVLESRFAMAIVNGMKTEDIQQNIIGIALELSTPEDPDWRYVAGRLRVWDLWREVARSRGFVYGDYQDIVRHKTAHGAYDERLREYSDEQLIEAGLWLVPDRDLDYDYAGATLLCQRYLLPEELPQEAYLTCALLLALPEPKEERLSVARRIYDAISLRKISLATPILANLRVPNGSLGSCFIVAMDDTRESIFAEITNTSRISAQGGGVGINLSWVRASGSWVRGKPNVAGGVVPWIKIINDTAVAVNQGGRRAGAATVGIDVWHLDVEAFLEMQLEHGSSRRRGLEALLGRIMDELTPPAVTVGVDVWHSDILEFLAMRSEHGDQRRKAFDVFPQVVVPDEFMRRVMADQRWTIVDPYEVRTKLGIELADLWGEAFESAYAAVEEAAGTTLTVFRQVRARELFKTMLRTMVETGLPYIVFKDTINRANPNKHEGIIPGANLCTESFSVVVPGQYAHSCNLVSLNLATIEDEELEPMCDLAVRLLDNTIDLTVAPFEEAGRHNEWFRTIGVGAMGLADWLAMRRLSYGHLDEIGRLFEDIAFHATTASMNLARERGAYPAFPGSEWSRGNMVGAKPIEWFREHSRDPARWERLREEILRFGVRNSHILAIAPNTSSSLVQGCTASILPTFSRFFMDKGSRGHVPVAPPFVRSHFWFYQENKTLDQRVVVDAVATIQAWVDTGISMELLFNLNEGAYAPDRVIRAPEIFEVMTRAWMKGCKAIYYTRTVQQDKGSDSPECAACSG